MDTTDIQSLSDLLQDMLEQLVDIGLASKYTIEEDKECECSAIDIYVNNYADKGFIYYIAQDREGLILTDAQFNAMLDKLTEIRINAMLDKLTEIKNIRDTKNPPSPAENDDEGELAF